MTRSLVALAVVLAVSGACGANTATQESEPPAAAPPHTTEPGPDGRPAEETPAEKPTPVLPENPADREIRRALTAAIAQDPQLKTREISFLVSNGDVSVTGMVGSEPERRRINDIAMSIAGVKSVANAVRVEE